MRRGATPARRRAGTRAVGGGLTTRRFPSVVAARPARPEQELITSQHVNFWRFHRNNRLLGEEGRAEDERR